MNDPAVKVTLALFILFGGFLAAITFRRGSASPQTEAPSLSELVALRNRRSAERRAPSAERNAPPPTASSRSEAGDVPSRSPTVLAPFEDSPPVPTLPSKYPGDGSPNSRGWGMPIVSAPDAATTGRPPRMHRIVDGDTLSALAERYLGSPSRATDIFRANRDVLSEPELLPIGGELKIPE
jgi:nucleoid-associated protein YgaU